MGLLGVGGRRGLGMLVSQIKWGGYWKSFLFPLLSIIIKRLIIVYFLIYLSNDFQKNWCPTRIFFLYENLIYMFQFRKMIFWGRNNQFKSSIAFLKIIHLSSLNSDTVVLNDGI